jgi:hypothetical protein
LTTLDVCQSAENGISRFKPATVGRRMPPIPAS